MKKFSAFMVLVFFSACGSPETPPPSSPDIAVNEIARDAAFEEFDRENAAAIAAYENSAPPYDILPKIPLQFNCNFAPNKEITDQCTADKAKIVIDWAQAWQGDYQAQRNIGYSFTQYSTENLAQTSQKPSGGFIVGNTTVQGCAWLKVLSKMGHGEFNDSDVENEKTSCANLDRSGIESSNEIAENTVKKIKANRQ